jgi:hypothetical protein
VSASSFQESGNYNHSQEAQGGIPDGDIQYHRFMGSYRDKADDNDNSIGGGVVGKKTIPRCGATP